MKSLILLVALAVLGLSQAPVAEAAATRANLYVGSIRPGDKLLSRRTLTQRAIANAVQYQDFVYRGDRNTRISAIHAQEIGYTQYAYAYLIAGGVGANNVTVRAQSARGYGFNYQIEVWGR